MNKYQTTVCLTVFFLTSNVHANINRGAEVKTCITSKSAPGNWPNIDVTVDNNCSSCKHITITVNKNGTYYTGAYFKNVNPGEQRMFSYDAGSPGNYKPYISKLEDCKPSTPPPQPPSSPAPLPSNFCPGPVLRLNAWPVKVAGRTAESIVDHKKDTRLCIKKAYAPVLSRILCLGKVDRHPDAPNQEYWQCESSKQCGDLFFGEVYSINLKLGSDKEETSYWCVNVSDESRNRTNIARFYILDK
ncbi:MULTISPECIES: hypothetical protein [Klebsiella]|uniref:hypothetical protein n=1 Tax=Klebsiella TaxID=570 RepID=UPI0027E72332|nr:hypothetical protein [Klebsiella michiganensis]MDQ7856495.1 hypothetical protein [Klebsiella michiganensis]